MTTMQVVTALRQGDERLVRELLQHEDADAAHQDEGTGESLLMLAAGLGLADSVVALLSHGAPWNALDRNGKCAGEYALEHGHQAIVDCLVTAGVTAELIFGEISKTEMVAQPRNQSYLDGKATYLPGSDVLLEEGTSDGVMMEWERPIMHAHAMAMAAHLPKKAVLNIGFGLGIIDEYFRDLLQPKRHVISEAHPDVLREMQNRGWGPNAVPGRWQDSLERLVELGPYDCIYFDTFGEHLDDMREFHAQLPRLLAKPDGHYSFFNGMCPNNIFFQGVACEVVRLDLENMGLQCEFHGMEVDSGDDGVWKDIARRYFSSNCYYLPMAKWIPSAQPAVVHRRDRKRNNPNKGA